MSQRAATVLQAGLAYFAIVFAAGFVLGTLRVGWAVGRFGERSAELAELPVMLLVCWLAARWVLRRFAVAASWRSRLAVGGIAFALLAGCELTVVLALRGLTPGEYFATRDPLAAAGYLLSLLLFALMPWLLMLAGRPRTAAR